MFNYINLKEIENQTNEICLEAVSLDGLELRNVNNQTDEICLAAVENNGNALQFVKNKTDEICLAAVKKHGLSLKYVDNQTQELCLEAVKSDSMAILYVEHRSEEVCLEAVKRNGMCLCFVKNQTKEICDEALKNNILSFIHMDTEFFEFDVNKIKLCHDEVKSKIDDFFNMSSGGSGIHIDGVSLMIKLFYEKLSKTLMTLDDKKLISVVDDELNYLLTEDVLNKYEELLNIKQKVEMLKLNLDKNNNNKIKPKII